MPSLSSLHFSSSSGDTERVLKSLEQLVGDGEYLKDEYDTFKIEKSGVYSMGSLAESLPAESKDSGSETTESEGIVDYQAIIKRLVVHDDIPSSKMTPYFNHHAFYTHLRDYQAKSKEGASLFGSNLLYGEVLTSTNTVLEKYVSKLFGSRVLLTSVEMVSSCAIFPPVRLQPPLPR